METYIYTQKKISVDVWQIKLESNPTKLKMKDVFSDKMATRWRQKILRDISLLRVIYLEYAVA